MNRPCSRLPSSTQPVPLLFAAIRDHLSHRHLFIASLEGLQLTPGRDPNLLGCPETTIPLTLSLKPGIMNAPSVDMTHLQEWAHTVLAHRLFKCLKIKNKIRSRAMYWPHCGFSVPVYRVLKLALLRHHANASLHLHHCSGVLDRSEGRDLLIE